MYSVYQEYLYYIKKKERSLDRMCGVRVSGDVARELASHKGKLCILRAFTMTGTSALFR